MANVLDFVEPGPLLSDEVVKQPIVSKAAVQRSISKLSRYWDDEQLEAVVSCSKRIACGNQNLSRHGVSWLTRKPSSGNGKWRLGSNPITVQWGYRPSSTSTRPCR